MMPEAEWWWVQALADMRSARIMKETGQYYAVSLFGQQAAEKGLKALWVEQHRGAVPPRIHDVRVLGGQVSTPSTLTADLDELAAAGQMARYPDHAGFVPAIDIAEQEAADVLDAAERVMEWLHEQI
jgi:HEPN domain-containing protein